METRISCGWMGHLSLIQTFPLLLSQSFQQLDSFRQFSIATNPLQQLLLTISSKTNGLTVLPMTISLENELITVLTKSGKSIEFWKGWFKNQILQARFTLLSYLTWMFSWFLSVITKGAGRQWLWSCCRLVGSRRGHVRNDVWSSTILQQGSWSSLWTYPDGMDSGVDV